MVTAIDFGSGSDNRDDRFPKIFECMVNFEFGCLGPRQFRALSGKACWMWHICVWGVRGGCEGFRVKRAEGMGVGDFLTALTD